MVGTVPWGHGTLMRDEKKGFRVQKVFVPVNKRSFAFVSMASMRVSRSVLPCGEMVRVPFRHMDFGLATHAFGT